jgi:hypothetical protein
MKSQSPNPKAPADRSKDRIRTLRPLTVTLNPSTGEFTLSRSLVRARRNECSKSADTAAPKVVIGK